MGWLDVASGAGQGLETLLARQREDELLAERKRALNETVRSHQSEESYRDRALTETRAERISRDAAAQRAREFTQSEKLLSGLVGGQSVPRGMAENAISATGDSTRFTEPNQTVRPTPSVMPLMGAAASMGDAGQQTPSVPTMDMQPVSKLVKPSTFLNYEPTGQQQLAERKIANDEAKAEAAANKTPAPTSAEADARAIDIRDRLSRNQSSVTPQDRSWLSSYETNKKLVTDQSGVHADERLAKTEKFQMQERGRGELGKVETLYRDASEKADVMRNATALARSGNVEAAAMTPLLAALGITTSEGVKRINAQEINAAAGAGSLLQRIRGQIGKWTTGQSIAPEVLGDIDKLASMLEQSSYKKYQSGHAAITKRYGLDDETPLDGPGGHSSSAPAATPKQVRYDANGNPIQ